MATLDLGLVYIFICQLVYLILHGFERSVVSSMLPIPSFDLVTILSDLLKHGILQGLALGHFLPLIFTDFDRL